MPEVVTPIDPPPADPEVVTTRCDKCGVRSPLSSLFTLVKKSSGLSSVCPACKRRAGNRLHLVLALFAVGMTLAYFGAAIATSSPDERTYSWDGMWFPLFLLFQYVSIIPHELAHALVARLTGIEVFQISLGYGRVIATHRVRGVVIEIRAIPGIGTVSGATLRMSGWRWRRIAFIAAGPLANAALCAIALWAAGGLPHRWNGGHGSEVDLLWLPLALANGVLCVTSLIPRSVQTPAGVSQSDGSQLRSLLFKPIASPERRRLAYFQSRGTILYAARDTHAATEIATQGLHEFPGDVSLQWLLANAHQDAGEYAAGRAIMLRLLEAHSARDAARAAMLNALAWADLMLATPDCLEEAGRASTEAYSLTPWEASVKSTRGLALVELRDAAAAVPLLRKAFRDADRREHRALVACSLALAQSRLGDAKAARRLWDKARRLDCKCELLPRVERELQPIALAAP
ncbi:MAG TPA: M50 family metallopeptidase [Tepidisphaeraceae bacterium]|nr:M50 family metallopeptidase [Tepidisphaeraceae bacterium]